MDFVNFINFNRLVFLLKKNKNNTHTPDLRSWKQIYFSFSRRKEINILLENYEVRYQTNRFQKDRIEAGYFKMI